ncbi:hypothetical protein CsatB_004842 [Cannabis sativa]
MGSGRGKVDKTPSKVKTRVADPALRLRTPDKYGAGISSARSERRNAIGKDFLRGFKECLEAVSKDSSANVVLIRSLVPNVFCAGADLKCLGGSGCFALQSSPHIAVKIRKAAPLRKNGQSFSDKNHRNPD